MVPFIFHLERNEYAQALQEATRLRTPENPCDPIFRAAAAGLLGNDHVAASAYREFVEQFPEILEDPASYIRNYLHFQRWIDLILKGLEKAEGALQG